MNALDKSELGLFLPLIQYIKSLDESGNISILLPIKFSYSLILMMKYFYSGVKIEFLEERNCKVMSGTLKNKFIARSLFSLWKQQLRSNPKIN